MSDNGFRVEDVDPQPIGVTVEEAAEAMRVFAEMLKRLPEAQLIAAVGQALEDRDAARKQKARVTMPADWKLWALFVWWLLIVIAGLLLNEAVH